MSDLLDAKKQPTESFVVGDRIQNTCQMSYFHGDVGTIDKIGRTFVHVMYDDGCGDHAAGQGRAGMAAEIAGLISPCQN